MFGSGAGPLMKIPVAAPKVLLVDKGYDGDFFCESLLIPGILPIITPKANRKVPEHPDYPLPGQQPCQALLRQAEAKALSRHPQRDRRVL